MIIPIVQYWEAHHPSLHLPPPQARETGWSVPHTHSVPVYHQAHCLLEMGEVADIHMVPEEAASCKLPCPLPWPAVPREGGGPRVELAWWRDWGHHSTSSQGWHYCERAVWWWLYRGSTHTDARYIYTGVRHRYTGVRQIQGHIQGWVRFVDTDMEIGIHRLYQT